MIYTNFNLFLKYENILPYSKCREISDTLKNLVYAPFSACLHVTFFFKIANEFDHFDFAFIFSCRMTEKKTLIKRPYFLFDWLICMFGISVTLRELTSNVNGRNFIRLECNRTNSIWFRHNNRYRRSRLNNWLNKWLRVIEASTALEKCCLIYRLLRVNCNWLFLPFTAVTVMKKKNKIKLSP